MARMNWTKFHDDRRTLALMACTLKGVIRQPHVGRISEVARAQAGLVDARAELTRLHMLQARLRGKLHCSRGFVAGVCAYQRDIDQAKQEKLTEKIYQHYLCTEEAVVL